MRIRQDYGSMFKASQGIVWAAALLTVTAAVNMSGCTVKEGTDPSVAVPNPPPVPAGPARPQPDRTGRPRVGVASFYAGRFAGREMADGTPMDPTADNAASRTLPLGTVAKVTDISTGESAVVTIKDRGPYAKGRLVDLSPSTARKIGISAKKGIARVRVSPIVVPLPDGSLKAGVAAKDPEVTAMR
jgi:rare lipoprotein A